MSHGFLKMQTGILYILDNTKIKMQNEKLWATPRVEPMRRGQNCKDVAHFLLPQTD